MAAELRWAWHTAFKSKSFNAEDDANTLLKNMFPDSQIASKFSCARTKMTYLINFAIAPYCEEKVATSLKDNPYSIAYDEADGYMMVLVRHIADGALLNDMLDLVPLNGNFTSENCTKAILSAIDNAHLPRRNCISDCSDSCNTMRGKLNNFKYFLIINCSFYSYKSICSMVYFLFIGVNKGVMKLLRKSAGLENLIDVGGCTLHTVSNGNRHATVSVFPDIPDVCEDVFCFFDKSCKRKVEFQKVSFFLFYCK